MGEGAFLLLVAVVLSLWISFAEVTRSRGRVSWHGSKDAQWLTVPWLLGVALAARAADQFARTSTLPGWVWFGICLGTCLAARGVALVVCALLRRRTALEPAGRTLPKRRRASRTR